MEGGDKDMEVHITTHQDDESIMMKNNQFMEEQSEPDFEQVLNKGPLLFQETFILIKHISNMLSIGPKPVQLVQPNLVESAQVKPIYTFFETSSTYNKSPFSLSK